MIRLTVMMLFLSLFMIRRFDEAWEVCAAKAADLFLPEVFCSFALGLISFMSVLFSQYLVSFLD